MKLLLHTCCGPCTIFPLRIMREQGLEVTGFFFRYNIHPYTECLKRETTLTDYARQMELPLICQEDYELEDFLRKLLSGEKDRCRICYRERLGAAARLAKQESFDCFSSTLLYSKFQRHDLIKSVGEEIARESGVTFYYQDFRQGWQEGVRLSKEAGMYRQSYCGCIFSEKERYYQPTLRSRQ